MRLPACRLRHSQRARAPTPAVTRGSLSSSCGLPLGEST
jgi:hypothetical protein